MVAGVKMLWKTLRTVDGLLYNLNANKQFLNSTTFSNFKISGIC